MTQTGRKGGEAGGRCPHDSTLSIYDCAACAYEEAERRINSEPRILAECWTCLSKETGTEDTVSEAYVRQRLEGWVKDIELAIKIGYGETCSFVYQKGSRS